MSNTIFRIFNPGAPKTDRTEKRRDQLRRAQRTYRERKERYTASLEKEVTRLMQDVDSLRALVGQQQTQLDLHGIELPGAASGIVPGALGVPAVSAAGTVLGPGSVSGAPPPPLVYSQSPFSPSSFNSFARSSPSSFPSTTANHSPASTTQDTALATPYDPGYVDSFPFQSQPQPQSQTHQHQHQHQIQHHYQHQHQQQQRQRQQHDNGLSDQDLVTVGMEFVLKIEEPCLPHIHGDPPRDDAPNGHALTASAQVLCHAHRHSTSVPFSPVSPYFSADPSQAASASTSAVPDDAAAVILERLLRLAPDLAYDGEVTPVQAWNHIRSRPQFRHCDVGRIRALAEELRDAVRCHG